MPSQFSFSLFSFRWKKTLRLFRLIAKLIAIKFGSKYRQRERVRERGELARGRLCAMVVSTPLLILAITASFLVGSALVVGLCVLLLVGLVAWDRQRKRKLAALASRHRLKGLEMVEENGAELASIGSAENLLSLVMHSHTPIGSPELTAMSITATTTRVLQHLDKHALVEAAEQEIALPTAPSPTPSPEAHRVAMPGYSGHVRYRTRRCPR